MGDDATQGGGGIYNTGTLVIMNNSMIQFNRATGDSGSGGGIFNAEDGTVRAAQSHISANTANRAGGGIEDRTDDDDAIILFEVDMNRNVAGPDGSAQPRQRRRHPRLRLRRRLHHRRLRSRTTSPRVRAARLERYRHDDAHGCHPLQQRGRWRHGRDGGGAIYNNGGTLDMTGGCVQFNMATGDSGSGGGAFINGGTATFTNVMFKGNTANRAGGGIEVASGALVVLQETDFRQNSTGDNPATAAPFTPLPAPSSAAAAPWSTTSPLSEGGGFWNNAGWTMNLEGMTFTGNEAAGDAADNGGGGLFNNGGTLFVQRLTISNNTASGDLGSGGGIFTDGGTLNVNFTTISNNSANRAGGGIEDRTDDDDPADDDDAPDDDDRGLDPLRQRRRDQPGNGGGLHVSGDGSVSVERSEVSGNMAVEGGGLWNSGAGTLEVQTTNVLNNTATRGGGVYQSASDAADGTLRILRSTLAFNDADGNGGGLYVEGERVIAINSTFSNNSADIGGGIYAIDGETSFGSVTIASNTADTRGGGFRDDGPAVLVFGNTIIGDNTAPRGPDCSGVVVSQDFNLLEQRGRTGECSGMGPRRNSKLGVDPRLGPLADNGGPTLTHALMPGSPAINMGDSNEDVDQRRVRPRPGPGRHGRLRARRHSTVARRLWRGGSGRGRADRSSPEAAALKTMTEPVRLDPIAPNPVATGRAATVTFTVREAEAVEVTLYDVAGRRRGDALLWHATGEPGGDRLARREPSGRWRLRRPPPRRDGAGDAAPECRVR